MKHKLKCVSCGSIYEPEKELYTCQKCCDRMGTLEVLYDYSSISVKKSDFGKHENIWQFKKLLPIEDSSYKTHLHIGGTPLYEFEGLLGLKKVYVKYDGGNPTASYKDRASAIAVTKACEAGYQSIYCASTGNAASSLAGLAITTNLKTYIFLPSSAPVAKMSQLFVYGARVIPIEGSYDEAFSISLQVGSVNGWYCRNSAINPYLLEGKKTGALEIAVQCDYKVPDYCLVPVGDGTVASSLFRGFYDFYKLGFIGKIPRIIGVQAKGSNSVYKAFLNGEPYKTFDIPSSNTVADSILVGKPRDVIKACKYIKASGGYLIDVEDEEILNSIVELSVNTGVFAEPAGAATYAGLSKLIKNGKIDKKSSVCLVVTGNGLKDIKAVEDLVNIEPVEPIFDKVMEYIEALDNN